MPYGAFRASDRPYPWIGKDGIQVKPKRIETPPDAFRLWLLAQTGRQDAVGRIALDVIGEERRLGRPLRCLEDRVNFVMFVRAMPREVGVTEADGLACWREWRREAQQGDTGVKSLPPSP